MEDVGLSIKPLTTYDVDEVAFLHQRAFPDFFLSSLGIRFLREFYRSFVGDENALTYVARDRAEGRLIGFIVGLAAPSDFFRRLAERRWLAFGIASLGAVLRKPIVIKRLFRARHYRGDEPERPGYALLSSIAVDPKEQARGVGAALLRHWIMETRDRGCAGAYLTTDAVRNDQANRFYQRNGWVVESTFVTPEGRSMNRYILNFQSGPK